MTLTDSGRRFLAAVLCMWLLPVCVPAASVPVSIAAAEQTLTLNGRLDWWPDAPADASIAAARAADAAFVPAPARASFGIRRQPLWFRVALHNEADASRMLMLESAFANIDEIDLYVVRGGVVSTNWQTGLTRDGGTRALSSPRFAFPLPLAAGETATLYVRAASRTVLNLPLALYDEHAYSDHVGRTRGWQGLFYGLAFGTLLCAALLWRTTGDHSFRHYTFAVLLALGYFLSMDGYLAYGFPAWSAQQAATGLFCATVSVAFTLWFARAFLETSLRAPRSDRTLNRIAWGAIAVSVLLPFLPLTVSMLLSMLFSITMAVSMLVAGTVVLRAGYRPARLLLLAMGVHVLTISLLSYSALGEIPGLFEFADNFHRVGFLFLLVCFTVGLGLRIRMSEDERRRAEETALQAAADTRARNEFLSRMSHELRTPMTGVLGMAELLDHTDLDDRQRRYLGTLRYSGEILLNLINDVLDHARLETGRLTIRRDAFDLLRTIDDCRMLFEQQPRDGGAVLRIDIGTGASRVVVGDAVRVRQLLVNMLLRAFRLAGNSAVDWRVRSLETPGWLRFEIECAGGAGDPAALVDSMGLGTSAQLAGLMGGGLVVQATPAAGTLYRLDLPLFAAT